MSSTSPSTQPPVGSGIVAIVQIGNSDDKLAQARWAEFLAATEQAMTVHGQLHFAGYSNPAKPWQNACFVVALRSVGTVHLLRDRLSALAKAYEQDSIALAVSTTEFIGG